MESGQLSHYDAQMPVGCVQCTASKVLLVSSWLDPAWPAGALHSFTYTQPFTFKSSSLPSTSSCSFWDLLKDSAGCFLCKEVGPQWLRHCWLRCRHRASTPRRATKRNRWRRNLRITQGPCPHVTWVRLPRGPTPQQPFPNTIQCILRVGLVPQSQ